MKKRQCFNVSFVLCILLCNNSLIIEAQNIETIPKQKPVRLSGGFTVQNGFYIAKDIDDRKSPYTYTISGSPTLTLYGVTLPFNFVISEQQQDFSQPFNRFGVSPYYKWIKLHAGHRNITFSPFTLAGHNFLGGGIELTPGKLRFGFVYGRFLKAVPEDTLRTYDNPLYNAPIPSYKRTGYSVKIGVGDKKNYIDFIYFKAKDDVNSIPYVPEKQEVLPAENAVFGISYQLSFLKRLVWKTDFGLSAYTTDILADELDSTILPMQGTIKQVITPRYSTQVVGAGESSLTYRQRSFALSLKYRRIDPEYKSMGAYYFLTDIQQYTIAPLFSLFKNKLIIKASGGYQHDNLYNKKLATTGKTIGSCNINFNASQKFGINFMYSNYGITQNPGLKSTISDTSKISQVSQNIAISPRLNLIGNKTIQTISLYTGYQELTDHNIYTSEFSEMTSIISNINYNVTFINSRININQTVSYNHSSLYSGTLVNLGYSIGCGSPLWKDKMHINGNIAYHKNYFESSSNGFTLNTNINISLIPFVNTKHSFNFGINWIKNHVVDNTVSQGFSEFIGTISYNYRF